MNIIVPPTPGPPLTDGEALARGRERIRVEKMRNKKGRPRLPWRRSDATDWFLSGRILRMPDYIMRRLLSKEGRETFQNRKFPITNATCKTDTILVNFADVSQQRMNVRPLNHCCLSPGCADMPLRCGSSRFCDPHETTPGAVN